jgi:sugar phosphate isomerase/epimerase
MLNRREMLLSAAGGFAACRLAAPARLLASTPLKKTPPKKTGLGVCIHSYMIRPRAERSGGNGPASGGNGPAFAEPLNFLEHCRRLGAAGVQVGLGANDETYASELRRRAEGYGMFFEGMAGLPRDRADADRFAAQLRIAKRAGGKVIRVVMMSGRRYERFDSAEQFRESLDRARKSLELAEPIAARERVRLAVENHKDQRIEEMLALLKHLDSEYVGVCVDTGNSIALLEDPLEVVKAYAPWAYSAHLKDMAVGRHEDGFLLSEVTLGEGMLDLAEMIDLLRRAKPDVQFSLEMITRDPLRVPCLTKKYWATLAGVPGRDLARTLRMVRDDAAQRPLPRVSHLPLDEQVEREEENVKKCLSFARDRLRL